MQNALSCPRRFHVIGRVVGWRMADTGHSETQTFCVRSPGARAAHHIRQMAERKISSTWSQVTPLAELNEMVQ